MEYKVGDKVRLIKTGERIGKEEVDYSNYLIKGKIYRLVGVRDDFIMVSLSSYWMHKEHFELYLNTKLNIIEFVELFLNEKLTSYEQMILEVLYDKKPIDMKKIKNVKKLSRYFSKYLEYEEKGE